MARAIDASGNMDGQVGLTCPSARGWTGADVICSNSTAFLTRFVAPRNMAIVSISFILTVNSATNDNCDVGIYEYSGSGSTLNRLVSSGSTAGLLNAGAPIVQSLTVASTLLVGGKVYYVAFATDASVASVVRVLGSSFGTLLPTLYGSGINTSQGRSEGAAFPLPSTLTGTANNNNPIVMSVKES